MGSISVLSFIYNEASVIEESLKCIRPHVDEIIVTDLDSTDGTREIAEKYCDQVYLKPWLMCGDHYKSFLRARAKCDYILWWYPDEFYPEKTAKALRAVVDTGEYTAYSFMRQEYMDNVRVGFRETPDGEMIYHGTPESPNYQNRLHKRCDEIFYTGLVHAEIHGEYHCCQMPPEYYMEHRKTSRDQEFDNVRLYIWYKYLVWLYGDTKVEPYKTYVDSYRKIIHDSEEKNATGERRTHPAEEEWWNWRDYPLVPDKDVVDRAIREMGEA